jgi:molybdenum cofactor synthesis domain-containing protein
MFNPESHLFKILIITLSDRASKGEYTDRSGPEIKQLVSGFMRGTGWKNEVKTIIIPDDAIILQKIVEEAVSENTDLIFTTGGTGIGPRDITVDTITPMLHKQIPGIIEMIRIKYGTMKPAALLTRAVAGIIGSTLVFTLPGSVKAVNEYCTEIFTILEHAFFMLYGIDKHK